VRDGGFGGTRQPGAAGPGGPERGGAARGTGKRYAVAGSGRWTDEEEGGRRLPAGEVHAWEPGRNETVCGLSLSRSRLTRLAHVSRPDVFPDSGGDADPVQRVCRRCAAAAGRRGADARPRWCRIRPRP